MRGVGRIEGLLEGKSGLLEVTNETGKVRRKGRAVVRGMARCKVDSRVLCGLQLL